LAINSAGQAIGSALGHTGDWHTFLYEDGSLQLTGGSYGRAINDAGHGTGSLIVKDDRSWATADRPFLVRGGQTRVIGWLGGLRAIGVAINESDQIAGYSDITGDGFGPFAGTHAFVYSRGRLSDLTPDRVDDLSAIAINESGEVAGNIAAGWDPILQGYIDLAFVRTPSCGDGVLDQGEECDDHNVDDGDCCASNCTYPGPVATCLAPGASRLNAKDTTGNTSDRLQWRWMGEGVAAGDFGDSPGETYTLCISDTTGGTPRLVTSLELSASGRWNGSTGNWQYEDRYGVESGITKASLRVKSSGVVDLRVIARGVNIPQFEPFSDAQFFHQDGRVVVQLFRLGSPTCWSSEFTTSSTNTSSRFSASAP
jgi:cysteine-rich repeat protein